MREILLQRLRRIQAEIDYLGAAASPGLDNRSTILAGLTAKRDAIQRQVAILDALASLPTRDQLQPFVNRRDELSRAISAIQERARTLNAQIAEARLVFEQRRAAAQELAQIRTALQQLPPGATGEQIEQARARAEALERGLGTLPEGDGQRIVAAQQLAQIRTALQQLPPGTTEEQIQQALAQAGALERAIGTAPDPTPSVAAAQDELGRLQVEHDARSAELAQVDQRGREIEAGVQRREALQREYEAIEQELRSDGIGFQDDPVGAVVVQCQARVDQYMAAAFRRWIVDSMRRINGARTPFGAPRFIYPHNRPDGRQTFQLPSAFWQPTTRSSHDGRPAPGESLRMSYRQRPTVTPAQAIRSLFDSNETPVVIECLTAIHICYYRAILHLVGDARFNQLFPAGVVLSPDSRQLAPYMTLTTHDHQMEINEGDWVYFYNDQRYLQRHGESQNSALQGENALYVGDGAFEGFGMDGTREEIEDGLRNAYNDDPTYWNDRRGQYERAGRRARQFPRLREGETIPGLISPRTGVIDPVIVPNVTNLRP
jgi:hypothetical protein